MRTARKLLLLVLAAVVATGLGLYRLVTTGARWPNSRGLIARILFLVVLIIWPAARRAGQYLQRL